MRSQAFPVATAAELRRAIARALGRRRSWLFLPLVVLLLGASACGLVLPLALGALVDVIGSGTGDAEGLPWFAAVMIGGVVASAALGGIGIIGTARLLESMLAELRERMVAQAFDLPQDRVERAGSGDLVARAVDDVAEVAEAIPEIVPAVSGSLFTIVVTVIAMAALDPRYALALVIVVPVHAVAITRYLRTAPPIYTAERAALSERAQRALDALYGLPTLRAYRLAGEHERRIGSASWAVVRWTIRQIAVINTFFARLNLAEFLGMSAILVVGFWLVSSGESTIGAVTAAMLLFLRLFAPMNGMLFVVDRLQSAVTSLARLVGVSTVPCAPAQAAGEPAGVELDGVGFAYEGGAPVLESVGLRIEPGSTLAIVGESGAGKSTLARLVAGVHAPNTGTISRPRGEGETVLVTQEVHVFDGTVRDNLLFAKPDASEPELLEALGTVGAEEAVRRLPDGLETRVGAGGRPIPAGLAQLLALARVLLADPRLVLLDEATAEGGSAWADELDRALRRVLEGRTGLIVTHRLSQAAFADRIAVVERGRLVELGTHAELLARGGPYAEFTRTSREATRRGG